MRVTPSQRAMSMLLGEWLPMQKFESLEDEIQQGRTLLKEMTGKDVGYDVAAWHDDLLATHEGGYTWSNTHQTYDTLVAHGNSIMHGTVRSIALMKQTRRSSNIWSPHTGDELWEPLFAPALPRLGGCVSHIHVAAASESCAVLATN